MYQLFGWLVAAHGSRIHRRQGAVVLVPTYQTFSETIGRGNSKVSWYLIIVPIVFFGMHFSMNTGSEAPKLNAARCTNSTKITWFSVLVSYSKYSWRKFNLRFCSIFTNNKILRSLKCLIHTYCRNIDSFELRIL